MPVSSLGPLDVAPAVDELPLMAADASVFGLIAFRDDRVTRIAMIETDPPVR